MVTGDGAYIKKLNRGLILQHVMQHGYISRADIAKLTGLNKATISVQVADLLEANLVTETQHEHKSVGRRPIMLSINGGAGHVLGINLDYGKISYQVANLQGQVVESKTTEIDTTDYEVILNRIAKEMEHYQDKYSTSDYGLVEIVIGVHGTVNKEEWIQFIPRLQWKNKDFKKDLKQKTGLEASVENNANLATFAESVFSYPKSSSLLGIVLRSGIGAGLMSYGKLIKGFDGYAGEVGHMIVSPFGKECKCGNLGCWELYAAEPVIYRQLKDKLGDPTLSNEAVRKEVENKNSKLEKVIEEFIHYLAIGLNNLINFHNPETIILNSDLLKAVPNAVQAIEEKLQSSVSVYRHIVLSDLGKEASVMGACALGIKNFFQVEEVTLTQHQTISK